jgi:hypothetical protein
MAPEKRYSKQSDMVIPQSWVQITVARHSLSCEVILTKKDVARSPAYYAGLQRISTRETEGLPDMALKAPH